MRTKNQTGFTIVELLIVIVIIGILAAITIVAYNGIQARSNNARRMSDIQSVAKVIEMYKAQNGSYPISGPATSDVRTDTKCSVGNKVSDWVPGVVPDFVAALPQSDGKQPNGANTGCYKYWSNGTYYVVSAWVGVEGGQQNSSLYRRTGFREANNGAADAYYCNYAAMGGMGAGAGPYNINNDLYKKSYTIASSPASNTGLTGVCDETPPAGA